MNKIINIIISFIKEIVTGVNYVHSHIDDLHQYAKQNKYKFDTNDTITVTDLNSGNNRILYRLIALKNFGCVKAGDKGGYIDLSVFLSEEGNCWVYPNSTVSGNVKIVGDVEIRDSDIKSHVLMTLEDNNEYNILLSGSLHISDSNLEVKNHHHILSIDGDNTIISKSSLYGNISLSGFLYIKHCCLMSKSIGKKIIINVTDSGEFMDTSFSSYILIDTTSIIISNCILENKVVIRHPVILNDVQLSDDIRIEEDSIIESYEILVHHPKVITLAKSIEIITIRLNCIANQSDYITKICVATIYKRKHDEARKNMVYTQIRTYTVSEFFSHVVSTTYLEEEYDEMRLKVNLFLESIKKISDGKIKRV